MDLIEIAAETACAECIYTVIVGELGIVMTVGSTVFVCRDLGPVSSAAPALQDKLYLLLIIVAVLNIEISVLFDVRSIEGTAAAAG